MGSIAGSGVFSDEEVDICGGYNHPAVVVQPFFISNRYLTLKKLMFLDIVFINQGKAVVRSQNVKYTTLWKVNIAGKSFLKIYHEF